MIKKAYVDTVDGQIHYSYTTGGQGAPLVLFHMTAASCNAMRGLMEAMEGNFPMIAFDTVNYGESYRTNQAPSIPYAAAVKLEALTNLGIEKFHTFGHHTGASIQVEMAVQAPGRVLSTVLNGPNYLTDEERAMARAHITWTNKNTIKGTQLIAAWSRIKDNMALPFFGEVPHAIEVMHRDTVDMLRAGENWDWGYHAVQTHDLRAAMQQLTCPMFMVSGERDVGHPFHELAMKDFPQAREHVCPDGGVYYAETHAEELAPHIVKFINELNAAS